MKDPTLIPKPVYLGDGVYAQWNAVDSLVLTTGTHLVESADAVIFLDHHTVLALQNYIEYSASARKK